MNVYFLVEGRCSEVEVYPAWLSRLLPSFHQAHRLQDVTRHSYYLVSGNGYPQLVQEALKNAIADVNANSSFSHLAVCLDADDSK